MKQIGFTLIELMVAVSIIGVVLLAVTQMLVQSLVGAAKAEAITRVKNNGDTALVAMERAIREGQGLDLTPAGQYDCTNAAGKPKVQFINVAGNRVVIQENSGRLSITEGINSRYITEADVVIEPNTLKFRCVDEANTRRDKVRISFRLSYNGGARASRNVYTDFYTSVMMRNKVGN